MSTDSYIDIPTLEQCETECVCPELVYPLVGRLLRKVKLKMRQQHLHF